VDVAVELAVGVGDLAVEAGSGGAPAAGGQGVDAGRAVEAGVGGEVAAQAAIGPVEGHAQPVVLDSGDHPAAQLDEQDQSDDSEAEFAAAGRRRGLVDPEQAADEALGAGSQGEQGGDGAGPDQEGDEDVGG
jgi:hypothetical protein